MPRMPRTSTFLRPQKHSFCLIFHLPRVRKRYTRRCGHVSFSHCRERLFLQAQRLRFPRLLVDAHGCWIHHQHSEFISTLSSSCACFDGFWGLYIPTDNFPSHFIFAASSNYSMPPSHAVKYEAATTPTTLTRNPVAVKGKSLVSNYPHFMVWCPVSAAASCFITLVLKESHNNLELIALDRLDNPHDKHGHVLDRLIVDVLQVLSRYLYSVNFIFNSSKNFVFQRRYEGST